MTTLHRYGQGKDIMKVRWRSHNKPSNIKTRNITYLTTNSSELQTLFVYHRTVVILKGFKTVVKIRYIKSRFVLDPVRI